MSVAWWGAAVAVAALGGAGGVPAAAAQHLDGVVSNPPACDALAHVGDSLTAAMADQLPGAYARNGWPHVTISAKGGRGIDRFLYDDMTGLEAVRRIQAAGFSGCWVMALGTNDTANADEDGASAAVQHERRVGAIRQMMDLLGDAPVMWVDVHLVDPDGGYSIADAAAWNAALREVLPDYPAMSILDWDTIAASHPEWTGDDHIHDTPEGSRWRAEIVTWAAAARFGHPPATPSVPGGATAHPATARSVRGVTPIATTPCSIARQPASACPR